MELAHPPIIASKLWQTVIIRAVEGERGRERVGGRKSSEGAWAPLMANRVVMGDGSSPSHQSTPSLSLGLAGGLSQHKPCPCSSLAHQRDPPLLPSVFATGSPWGLLQDNRLVCGDHCSSPQLGGDVWQVGFPLGPHSRGAQKLRLL